VGDLCVEGCEGQAHAGGRWVDARFVDVDGQAGRLGARKCVDEGGPAVSGGRVLKCDQGLAQWCDQVLMPAGWMSGAGRADAAFEGAEFAV